MTDVKDECDGAALNRWRHLLLAVCDSMMSPSQVRVQDDFAERKTTNLQNDTATTTMTTEE